MIYFIGFIWFVFFCFLLFELVNKLFALGLREKYSSYFVRYFVKTNEIINQTYTVSICNRVSFVLFAVVVPYYFTYVRREYTGSYIADSNSALEFFFPIIFLVVAFFLLFFCVSTLWHSAHLLDDSIIIIPINPLKTFRASLENLYIAKGTRNTKMGLVIFQIFNAEQGRWYYCLLDGFEELGLEEKTKDI